MTLNIAKDFFSYFKRWNSEEEEVDSLSLWDIQVLIPKLQSDWSDLLIFVSFREVKVN